MTILAIDYFGYREAESLEPQHTDALISIRDEDMDPKLSNKWEHLLVQRFPDASYDVGTIVQLGKAASAILAWNFTPAQAMEIRAFLHHLHEREEGIRLFVHCYQGKSRSAAVARYVAETYGLPLHREPKRLNPLVYALLRNPEVYARLLQKQPSQKLPWWKQILSRSN